MVNIHSREYAAWHRSQMQSVKRIMERHGAFTRPVSVIVGISFGDKRKRDLDNALTSVMDLLKDSGLIADDDWRRVCRVVSEVLDIREHYAIVTIDPADIPNSCKSGL
ncbi:RusA family crossover junction endodeoxyribonuclease [Fibrobacter intestinalis]|uniref:RusA family crossover junction endodeoxyribonuclease n=1 Tax=Fibrobacter sp. NR9 TaxID=1896200 RepID=UPI0013047850